MEQIIRVRADVNGVAGKGPDGKPQAGPRTIIVRMEQATATTDEGTQFTLSTPAVGAGIIVEIERLDGIRQEFVLGGEDLCLACFAAGARIVGGGWAGVCRICGCTEDEACPEGCSWADETRTLCDNPECVGAAAKATAGGGDG